VRPYLFGDYYPLLPYNPAADTWAAWQWDRPDLGGDGAGLPPAGEQCRVHDLKLQGLVPEATYTLTNLDDHSAMERTGGTRSSRLCRHPQGPARLGRLLRTGGTSGSRSLAQDHQLS